MKNFLLIGAAGYIAPRHMKAIKDTGNNLLAGLDPHDSVGVLDSYFPDCHFFTEFERFDRHCDKLKRAGTKIDYVVVCSPNYLHDAHIRFGLRIGADVICEKPVVLNPWNVDALLDMEKETGRQVFTLLQLRQHPSLIQLKAAVDESGPSAHHIVRLQYISSRGSWYHSSWKGDILKSGGVATNIGLHFFDLLSWVFGEKQTLTVTTHTNKKAKGTLLLEKASVEWALSIDSEDLPAEAQAEGRSTWRVLTVDGKDIHFSDSFEQLHTAAYQAIFDGNGVKLQETRKTIELVHDIRNLSGQYNTPE